MAPDGCETGFFLIPIAPGLEDTPELINNDPYGEGWIIKVDISDVEELGSLMDATAYQEMVA